ncbi:MAG: hypothetical protein M3Y54_05320 [Bacteroidota bacterium]|nr:hypothetical protein [Bacteroidota bacterium]
MKSTIFVLRALLAAAGVIFFGRMAFLFFRTGREALAYSTFAYYDPTVFVVVGLLLLPPLLLILRYVVRLLRRAGRR